MVDNVEPRGRYVGMVALMAYTSLGKNRAKELARKANAEIRFGRRVVYDTVEIDKYLTALKKG